MSVLSFSFSKDKPRLLVWIVLSGPFLFDIFHCLAFLLFPLQETKTDTAKTQYKCRKTFFYFSVSAIAFTSSVPILGWA